MGIAFFYVQLMSRVIAWKEPTWFGENEERAMWHLLCRAYDIEYTRLNPQEYPVIGEDEAVVLLDEQGTVDLHDFVHPENAVYIFGRTHQNDMLETIPHQHSVVISYPGNNTMFGITACAIMLDDRKRKLDGSHN